MKKAIALVITDTHYYKDNTDEVNGVMEQALDRAIYLGCTYLIHAGDVFTDRVGRSLKELLAFHEFLNKVKESGIKFLIIPGNHDKTDQNDIHSYLSVFKNYKNVTIFEKESYLVLSDEFGFCFLPYFPEGEKYDERLENLRSDISLLTPMNRKWFLFTHIAINGVKNNDGTVVDDGAVIDKFSKFEQVFVGHYHNRQAFGNVNYFGSLMPQNFGEDNEKGWLVIYKDFSFELENASFRPYKKLKFDLTKKTGLLLLDKATKKYANNENHIRFVIKGEESQLAQIDVSYYSKLGIDVKKENIFIIRSMIESNEVKKMEMTKEIMIDEFQNWAKELELEREDVEFGLNLLKQGKYVANK